MIGLLLALIGLGKSVLLYRQASEQNKTVAMSQYWQYQIAFIQATSGVETRIMRQVIVLAFVAALFSPAWGAVLTANARALPAVGWLIIVWEFFGAAALNILPWYKGVAVAGDRNGDGMPDVPDPIVPTPSGRDSG